MCLSGRVNKLMTAANTMVPSDCLSKNAPRVRRTLWTMNRTLRSTSLRRRIVRSATTALVVGGLAVSGLGLTAGSAEAQPGPVPLGAWPGCPNDHPDGPCRWCPGDPPVQTGNLRVNPVIWDEGVCHTYWYVYFGQGNVAQNIFEGDTPPPPPPPLALINRDNCQQILGIFCPRA
jgi:hypothetical protein